MQLPDITLNKLYNLNDDTLLDLCQAMTTMRAYAPSEEELGTLETALAFVEIELWSRGYEPPQKQ